jgi:hypothetical protein
MDQPEFKTQSEMFTYMERHWSNVCFVTGQEIYRYVPDNFFHILPKGAYPHYKLKLENMLITTLQFHHDWHQRGQEYCLATYPRAALVYERYEELKRQYYQQFYTIPKFNNNGKEKNTGRTDG